MSRSEKILSNMAESPSNVTYAELLKVCIGHFGEPRQNGTSHAVFAMPWAGDPRVNIQAGKGGKAKAYQVKQVLAAIAELNGESEEQE